MGNGCHVNKGKMKEKLEKNFQFLIFFSNKDAFLLEHFLRKHKHILYRNMSNKIFT